jgi:branched-chain amino acid transport system ATP-binding protein
MGLAPIIVKEIFTIIKDINKTGTTVLLVEQNAFMALNAADRAYIIRNGEIDMQGNAKELLQDEKVKKAYLGG